MDAAMVEPDVMSEQWLIPIGHYVTLSIKWKYLQNELGFYFLS